MKISYNKINVTFKLTSTWQYYTSLTLHSLLANVSMTDTNTLHLVRWWLVRTDAESPLEGSITHSQSPLIGLEQHFISGPSVGRGLFGIGPKSHSHDTHFTLCSLCSWVQSLPAVSMLTFVSIPSVLLTSVICGRCQKVSRKRGQKWNNLNFKGRARQTCWAMCNAEGSFLHRNTMATPAEKLFLPIKRV